MKDKANLLLAFLGGVMLAAFLAANMPKESPPPLWQCPACFEFVNLRDGRWPSQVPFKKPKSWPRENVQGLIVQHERQLAELRKREQKKLLAEQSQ